MIQQSELLDEVRRVADAIHNVFDVEGDLEESDVESLHDQFVECVDAVNQRLRKCDDLLRKGLRVEAIQECEIEPNLLDLVTEVDLPAWDAWADYVRQFGIPPQPPLLLDVAAALNEAYSEARPLEDLMRLHRLHALARSTLKTRLKILRGIGAKDADNPVWEDDIREYETARLREINEEFRQYRQQRDISALNELGREIDNASWLIRPSAALVEQVSDCQTKLRIENARKRLAVLEQEINSAFSDFDLSRAKLARTQWDKTSEIAQLADDDPLAQQVAPAFDWLDDEKKNEDIQFEYERALGTLEAALDEDGIKKTELVRLFSVVERFDETIPERVRRRYSERIRTFEAAESRRSRYVLLTSLAGILILGGTITFVIFWQIRSGKIKNACNDMAELLAEDRIGEAESLYKKLESDSPFIVAAPRMRQLHSSLQQKVQEEQDRKRRLKQFVDRARQLGLQEPTWESIAEAFAELANAESIARLEGERVTIKETESEIEQEKTRLQTGIDEVFRSDVAKLNDRMLRLDELDLAQIRGLKSEAERLKRRDRVSADARRGSEIDKTIAILADRESNYELYAKKREATIRVVGAIGSPTSYANALRVYIGALPSGGRAKDFEAIGQNELKLLPQVETWSTLAGRWNGLSFDDPLAIGTQGASIVSEIESKFADFPSAAKVIDLKDYLESMKRRSGSSGTTLAKRFAQVFENDIFALNYIEDREGNRHYFQGSPRVASGSITVSVLNDIDDLSDVQQKEFLKTRIQKFGEDKYYNVVPQAALAKQAMEALARSDLWFEAKICVILHIFFEDDRIDPILKCNLLQVIVTMSKPGSSLLAKELEGFEKAISASGDLSAVNWLSAEDGRVAQKRRSVAGALRRVRQSPSSIYTERIHPALTKIYASKQSLPQLVWVGIVLKNDDGKWGCRVKEGDSNVAGVLLVREYPQSGAPHFVEVGAMKGGTATLDESKEAVFVEGRPVFLVKSPK